MKGGGAAFPCDAGQDYDAYCKRFHQRGFQPGMTMRQYYKAAALTGIIMAFDVDAGNPGDDSSYVFVDRIAKWASQYADAMIREDEEHESRQSDK